MPSPREQVADELVEFLAFAGLNESYGINKSRGEENGKNFWSITFAKAGTIDGIVRVYSERFILVKFQRRRLETKEVFRDVTSAKRQMTEWFIQ
jgi:hypothetical protein